MLRAQIRMSIALGVLSIIGLAFSVAALSDIARGEADVSMEWRAVRATVVVLLIFIAMSLATLTRAARAMHSQ